jgi:hypothetical protein
VIITRITALLKWAGRMAREILVEWSNFGKERPSAESIDISEELDDEIGSRTPSNIDSQGNGSLKEDAFVGLCPECGKKKMLIWVQLSKSDYARLYCRECATSMKSLESAIPELVG